jgi:hypothetical protein
MMKKTTNQSRAWQGKNCMAQITYVETLRHPHQHSFSAKTSSNWIDNATQFMQDKTVDFRTACQHQ